MKKTRFKLWVILIAILWSMAWAFIAIPFFTSFITQNYSIYPIPVWTFIVHAGYFISLLLLMFFMTMKFNFSLRLALGFTAIIEGLTMWIPPLCVQPTGYLLVSVVDKMCYAGTDAAFGWLFAFLLGWGNPLLRYVVYGAGPIILFLVGILILKPKEIIDAFHPFDGAK